LVVPDLQSSRGGGHVHGGGGVDVSGKGSGVDGTTGLGHIDALMAMAGGQTRSLGEVDSGNGSAVPSGTGQTPGSSGAGMDGHGSRCAPGGTVPAVVPGAVPGTVPGAVPGSVPQTRSTMGHGAHIGHTGSNLGPRGMSSSQGAHEHDYGNGELKDHIRMSVSFKILGTILRTISKLFKNFSKMLNLF